MALASAEGLLAMLDESDSSLKAVALKKLEAVVDNFWPEIFDSIEKM